MQVTPKAIQLGDVVPDAAHGSTNQPLPIHVDKHPISDATLLSTATIIQLVHHAQLPDERGAGDLRHVRGQRAKEDTTLRDEVWR